MPNEIEERGISIVKKKLGSGVERPSGGKFKKTFDLEFKYKYIEVKSTKKPYRDLEFITLTKNQYKALKDGIKFDIYLVCSVMSSSPIIYVIKSTELAKKEPRVIESYEYRRSLLDSIHKIEVK